MIFGSKKNPIVLYWLNVISEGVMMLFIINLLYTVDMSVKGLYQSIKSTKRYNLI